MTAHQLGGEADPVSRPVESDEALARRVQEGDSDAFELLARKYMRPVYAIVAAFMRGQQDIDDSVQETFLRALERIRTYNPGKQFAPWLFQVARNVARNRYKYIRNRTHEPLSDLAQEPLQTSPEDPGRQAELSELRGDVEAAIESLPDRQRAAFRLHDIEGFKATEIAEMLGISDGAVRANIHHARRALRKRLERHRQETES